MRPSYHPKHLKKFKAQRNPSLGRFGRGIHFYAFVERMPTRASVGVRHGAKAKPSKNIRLHKQYVCTFPPSLVCAHANFSRVVG